MISLCGFRHFDADLSIYTLGTEIGICHVLQGLVSWHSGRTSGLWPANFPCPTLDLQLMVTTNVGKPSAIGQPTIGRLPGIYRVRLHLA